MICLHCGAEIIFEKTTESLVDKKFEIKGNEQGILCFCSSDKIAFIKKELTEEEIKRNIRGSNPTEFLA
jgi:hypothetical protein